MKCWARGASDNEKDVAWSSTSEGWLHTQTQTQTRQRRAPPTNHLPGTLAKSTRQVGRIRFLGSVNQGLRNSLRHKAPREGLLTTAISKESFLANITSSLGFSVLVVLDQNDRHVSSCAFQLPTPSPSSPCDGRYRIRRTANQARPLIARISTTSTLTSPKRVASVGSPRRALDGSLLQAARPSPSITATSATPSGAERPKATRSRYYSVTLASFS